MLKMDTKMFLQSANSLDNVLFPVTIVEVDTKNLIYTAVFDEENEYVPEQCITFEAGQDILVYHEERCEFMKQSASVEEILHSESGSSFCFKTTSELVSAENRQCYRTSTIITGLLAEFGPEQDTPLLDISPTGFAVVSTKPYNIGDIVDVVLHYENQKFYGAGCVQSIQALPKGRIRYGLLGVNDKKPSDNLKKKGLVFISAAIQRLQLQRLAGVL